MTITQLEYIVAVAECGSFAKAAKKCFVTQSTLSIQVKKLEKELNALCFDRTKIPVRPTNLGLQVIEQAKITIGEFSRITELSANSMQDCSGELRLGIIPTISPYLVPVFSIPFLKKQKEIRLSVHEMQSSNIISALSNNELDIGVLVTPIENSDLLQIPLYYEPFVAYISPKHPLSNKKQIGTDDLDHDDLWVLKEEHCFGKQISNIMGIEKKRNEDKVALRFESGSVESLRRLVDQQIGYTLLPSLATLDLRPEQCRKVKDFEIPQPVREVSIVISRRFTKRAIVESLRQSIVDNIPDEFKTFESRQIIPC